MARSDIRSGSLPPECTALRSGCVRSWQESRPARSPARTGNDHGTARSSAQGGHGRIGMTCPNGTAAGAQLLERDVVTENSASQCAGAPAFVADRQSARCSLVRQRTRESDVLPASPRRVCFSPPHERAEFGLRPVRSQHQGDHDGRPVAHKRTKVWTSNAHHATT